MVERTRSISRSNSLQTRSNSLQNQSKSKSNTEMKRRSASQHLSKSNVERDKSTVDDLSSRQSSSKSSRRDSLVKSEGNKVAMPFDCECGPDLYTRILGPTADEAILTGLQTVIDLCNKLKICNEKQDESEDESLEEPLGTNAEVDVEEDNLPEPAAGSRRVSNTLPEPAPESRRSSDSHSQTSRKTVFSEQLQVSPSMSTQRAQTNLTPPMSSEFMQTIPVNEPRAVASVHSKVLQSSPSVHSRVLQTSAPNVNSKVLQTSSPNLRSGFMQTSTVERNLTSMQTSNPSIFSTSIQTAVPSSRSGTSQTFAVNTQSGTVQTIPSEISEHIIPKSFQAPTSSMKPSEPEVSPEKGEAEEKRESKREDDQTKDEHSCISPPEPPKSCQCCRCTSSSTRSIIRKGSSSSHHHPECPCHGSKPRTKCKCSSGVRRGESSGVSVSRSMAKGDSNREQTPLDVRYAITRISKYEEFTTYEIMKPTRNVPKKMPKSIEGVFVLRKKKQE